MSTKTHVRQGSRTLWGKEEEGDRLRMDEEFSVGWTEEDTLWKGAVTGSDPIHEEVPQGR